MQVQLCDDGEGEKKKRKKSSGKRERGWGGGTLTCRRAVQWRERDTHTGRQPARERESDG
jgi:hypothetical protein